MVTAMPTRVTVAVMF